MSWSNSLGSNTISLNASSNSSTIWITPNSINPTVFSSGSFGTYTSSSIYSIKPKVDIKRCRNCNHAHIEGQQGCIDAIGNDVFFKDCSCIEYVPSDNLEYLEYLDKKQENK